MKKGVVLLLIGLVLCLNVVSVKSGDDTFQAQYIGLSSYTFQPNQETIITCNLNLHALALVNVSVYGDFFELESGWTVRWIKGLASLTTLDRWTNITFGVTPSANCFNRSYGIAVIGWWNGSAEWVLVTYFNVNGTKTWIAPESGHNYTYPEHQFITRDLFPHDLYLPVLPQSKTVYFKWTTNETEGRWFWISYDQSGNGQSSTGERIWAEPNVEKGFSFPTSELVWGGPFNVTFGISETEADANAGICLDRISQKITLHCPNGENSPSPALTDQGNAIPDVNGDGTVNMRDIQADILLFNTNPSSPNWNEKADVNGDGTVNMRDINLQIQYFNKYW